ncbi:MAG: hypothetical protein SFU86_15235 [Pirellulaceae bacterium]|nr:hypothetical protein [Pirellulaceae bacterium]
MWHPPSPPPLADFDWQPPAEPLEPRAPPGPRSARQRQQWRRSWRFSTLLHGWLAAACALQLLLAMKMIVPASGEPRQVELSAVQADDPSTPGTPLADLPIQIHDDATAEQIAEDQISRVAARVDPALAEQILTARDASSEDAAASWVQARVAAEIAAAEALSGDDQLAKLRQLTGTLNRISSPDSVEAVTGRLQTLLGTEHRASQPASEPVAGEFDLDTAQLHDVKRIDDGSGGHNYVAIMLDSAGRTLETPLDAAEGERLFGIFELIKSNPLLERVYRGVVLSLLDKLLKAPAARAPNQTAP